MRRTSLLSGLLVTLPALAAPPPAAAPQPVLHVVTVGDTDPSAPLGGLVADVLGVGGVSVSWTDSSQHKERGITINTSHVEYATRDRRVVLVDADDETAWVRAVVTGGERLDAAVLEVDAASGITTVVEDAAYLAQDLGATELVVWVDGADRVEADLVDKLDAQVRELVWSAGFDGDRTPILHASAERSVDADADVVRELLDVLHGARLPLADRERPFLMPIEEVFSISRRAVAEGRIESGVARAGTPVEIVGMGRPTLKSTITGIEMFRKGSVVGAGDHPGLAFDKLATTDLVPGQVIAAPGAAAAYTTVSAEVYVMRKSEGGRHTPFHNKYRPQFRIRTTDVTGEIELPVGRDSLVAGDHGTITVKLIVPVAMDKGLRFTIVEGGRTVGAGQVIEVVK